MRSFTHRLLYRAALTLVSVLVFVVGQVKGRSRFHTGLLLVFLTLAINTISISAFSQDVVYWRGAAPNGEWDWGGNCNNTSVGGNWNYNTGGDRLRPDCFIPNIIHFDNSNQLTMNLNSGADFSIYRLLFDAGTGDRIINTNVPRSLYFFQSAGNAKIENLASVTTQTFNVNVNVSPSTWMEINPVWGYLIFNNPVVNNRAEFVVATSAPIYFFLKEIAHGSF